MWLNATFLLMVGPTFAYQPILQVANDNGERQQHPTPQSDPSGTEG